MVRHTLKILQHLLYDFESVSDHFGTLCIKYLSDTLQEHTKNPNKLQILNLVQ